MPATLLLAQSPPAYATEPRGFDARSEWGSAPHDGQAHAWGTVTWHDKTKAVITGRINHLELCADEIDMPFRPYGDSDCVRLYNPYI